MKDIKSMLEHINQLKKDRDEAFKKAETDPIQAAKEMGIDISKFTPENLENLKSWSENLAGLAENFSSSVVNSNNPKSKGVENITNKVRSQGNVSPEDQDLMNKLMGNYIRDEQKDIAKGCFHYDQDSCKGGIISAHSLQKQGPLINISELQNNQQKVIHFTREPGKKWHAKPIAIKEASTFKGFCHHHDDIFSIIEQEPYSNSDKQNFLHSYRSFAYSYHQKLEKYAYVINIIDGAHGLGNMLSASVEMLEKLGIGTEKITNQLNSKTDITPEQENLLKIERFEQYKSKLNKDLQQNKYDNLEFFSYELNHICPVVCASWVKVHIETPFGFVIQDPYETYNGYPLLLTIFHTERNTTVVLLSRFKSDSITEHVFNQLRKLSNEELEIKLTSLIFEQVENFYLSPVFWNYLPETEKNKIVNDINEEKYSFPNESTFKASINLFDPMHKLKI